VESGVAMQKPDAGDDSRKAARSLIRAFKHLGLAFEHFGLDPQKLDDWDRLRAEYFRPRPCRKGGGRKKGSAKWDSYALRRLYLNWQRAIYMEGIDHELLPPGRDERPRQRKEAFHLLCKHFPDEYKDDSASSYRAICRRLSAAMRAWKQRREHWDKWIKQQREDLEKRIRKVIQALGDPDELIRQLDEAMKVDLGEAVKIDFSVVLKDWHGNNIEELDRAGKPRPVTLGDMCCDVLDVHMQQDQGARKQILRRFDLIRAITNAKEPLEVLDSDAQMIKDRLLSSARSRPKEVEGAEALTTN
jgi:hypothetical protein